MTEVMQVREAYRVEQWRQLMQQRKDSPLNNPGILCAARDQRKEQLLLAEKTARVRRFMFTGTQCDLWGRPDGTGQKISREIISRLIFCSCCSFSIRIRQLPTSY